MEREDDRWEDGVVGEGVAEGYGDLWLKMEVKSPAAAAIAAIAADGVGYSLRCFA